MKKLLLVVDPQVDFISGTLPVPDAAAAMDALARFVSEHGAEYVCCALTADWHPYNHFSFSVNGGQWPRHCVAYSVGAAIWPALFEAVNEVFAKVEVLTKGVFADREEYSVFANARSAERLDALVREHGIERIDVCGIAGDVCVADTLKDGVARYGAGMFHVLRQFSPSLDGGAKLDGLIENFGLL